MKHVLLSFILISCFAQYGFAQKIRYTDTSNVWYTADNDYFKPQSLRHTTITKYTKDTAINGKQYLRLNPVGWVREDTTQGIVYCIAPWDSVERIYFNYNLQIGDTLISHAAKHYFGSKDTFVLMAIDSIQINGYWHRVQKFSYSNDVIEGIGFEGGPLNFIEPPRPDMWLWLCCFYNKGAMVTAGNYVNATTCALGIDNQNKASENVRVVPHPANKYSKIILPNKIRSGNITVINSIGQQVFDRRIINEDEILIEGLINKPGIYYYRISGNDKAFTGKILYE